MHGIWFSQRAENLSFLHGCFHKGYLFEHTRVILTLSVQERVVATAKEVRLVLRLQWVWVCRPLGDSLYGSPTASSSFGKTPGVLTFAEPAVQEVDHTLYKHHW